MVLLTARGGGRSVGSTRMRRVLAVASLALVLLATPLVSAEPPSEQAVKSVYLFKLADYVEWPKSAFAASDSPLIIGVLGPDTLGQVLDDAVRGRTVMGHPIVVRRFDHLRGSAPVHVLFISPERTETRKELRAEIGSSPILTVSEKDADSGAIVGFVLVDKKVRFEIDADAAKRAGLKLSSQLLSLATAVRQGAPEPEDG